MKKIKMILMIMLLLFPCLVSASDGSGEMSIGAAIFMEAFITIHMSVFVLSPLSKMISPNDSKGVFRFLFVGRIIILLVFDFFITPMIAMIDFFALFVGTFLLIPMLSSTKRNTMTDNSNFQANDSQTSNTHVGNVILKCTKCGQVLQTTDAVCPKCGAAIEGNNIQVVQDNSPIVVFDETYSFTDDAILKKMIVEEIKLQGEDEKTLVTKDLYSRKKRRLVFLTVCTLFCSFMFFFNIPLIRCLLIELIALIIYRNFSKKSNIINVLMKEAKNNPDVEISNLVTSVKNQKQDTIMSNNIKIAVVVIVGILLPCVIFFSPKVIYAKYGDGYKVLRYTRGLLYNEEITIPDTYKGKRVLAIEESAFKYSNVKRVNLPEGLESIKVKAFFGCNKLEEITIPTTVYEIRSQAFANCTSLKTVNLSEGLIDIRSGAFAGATSLVNIELPDTLRYLGANAFLRCFSLEEITIPKGVVEINGATFAYNKSLKTVNLHDDIISIHGEVFRGCSSLKNIKLPSKITEIRGNTFENCKSLSSIEIPEGVTRIGGHAFYGCSSLKDVTVPSTVKEIGSSAFRQCYSLRSIEIPFDALVNERAFKESPTTIYRY